MRRRLVVCSVAGVSGALELPESRWAPERALISGGERSLYELAVAATCAGWDVELRGAINQTILTTITSAAGASPTVGLPPRRPAEGEVVVIPETADHQLLAALRLSGATTVMDLLAPPGLFGWSFSHGWTPPDPSVSHIGSIGTVSAFRAIHEFGITMWSPSHGAAEAAHKAGVPAEWIGTGTPVPFPDVPEKTFDLAVVAENRWAEFAETIVGRLDGMSVLRIPRAESLYSLSALLAPARILVWPSRIEGMSRISREARAVGTVPVALDTNPFATAEDHGGGVALVPDIRAIEDEIMMLIADPDRLAALRSEAVETARLQVAWQPYIERVAAALDVVVANDRPAAGAVGLVGDALWGRVVDDIRASEAPRAVLEAEVQSLTHQLAAAAEEMKTTTQRSEQRLESMSRELELAKATVAAYQNRRIMRLLDSAVVSGLYRGARRLAGGWRRQAR